ncbi:B3 domain-containing transcription factor VRN1-like [Pistacia vera]|uniref:B3 domain-containing transcription factor VRN1-like n=1 Tax=Pistacia vera TaxID=55513 RepID=UPI0012635079|nr:B3 domain-containing transcription factor VRN1-like [Pistacia vera]
MSNAFELEETPSHFFKVILSSTLEDKKLMIPGKFARKFWSELSGVAKLRVSSGLVWQVGLTKYARKIWFKDGWHNFAETNSIKIGYFVVFKYVKNSTFDVLIFDTTACEIQYPNNRGEPGNKKQKMSHKARPSEASVWSSKFKQGHEPPPRKKSKMEEEVMQRNESMHDGNEHDFMNLLEHMGIFLTEKCRAYVSAEERKRAINIARLLKPKNPAFMTILQSSYLYTQRLYVPSKFANKYLTRDVKFVKLQLPNGSECMIKICWRLFGGFNLTRGWAEIAKTLNLEKGDICIFELIKREDFLLNVSVFYATKE